jgi:predicted N-acetyltransferase YhbS
VLAPYDGIGLQRRLIRTLEEAARRLGAERVILGGPAGAEREFYLSMGYRGRHDGGLMTKALPRLRGRGAQPSLARPLP